MPDRVGHDGVKGTRHDGVKGAGMDGSGHSKGGP